MAVGIFQLIVICLALYGAGELLLKLIPARGTAAAGDDDQFDIVGDIPCLWPRLEPEVERLREKGAL